MTTPNRLLSSLITDFDTAMSVTAALSKLETIPTLEISYATFKKIDNFDYQQEHTRHYSMTFDHPNVFILMFMNGVAIRVLHPSWMK